MQGTVSDSVWLTGWVNEKPTYDRRKVKKSVGSISGSIVNERMRSFVCIGGVPEDS